jgi:hypothetical protein
MPDEYGLPQPDNPEDWQQFMLGVFDTIEEANNVGAPEAGIRLLSQAREIFKAEFQRKFPGHGKGRAVW